MNTTVRDSYGYSSIEVTRDKLRQQGYAEKESGRQRSEIVMSLVRQKWK